MADEPSEVENWTRERVLGSGGFGVVTLWKNKITGKMIAIKKCRYGTDIVLTPKQKERWTNEVDIMQRLNHNGVVRTLPIPPELDLELKGELPLLCMEFCARGDLRQVLNKPESCCGLREQQVRAILRDVSNAVEYLHANKITHRDLKPENIVMQDTDSNSVVYKLIDLGYAKELDQSSMCASFVGTLQYLAPELFLSKRYSCTVDYWSLGLVAHEVITGLRPFLPNMTPVAWMQHVQRKSQDDICAYEDRDGTIIFSPQLYPQNHISKCLQYPIEQWLRLVLDWDPKRRGRGSDSNQLLVFSLISSILEKKIVPVYCIPTGQECSYEVDDSTELATLQGWINIDTKIPVSEQELLLTKGTAPDPKLPASQCCPPNGNSDWFLLVFRRGELALPKIKPNVPPLVRDMMEDAKSPVPYSHQKRAWAHAVFFLQQEANLYCNFLRAHRAKLFHTLGRTCDLGKLVQKIIQERVRTIAQHDFYTASLATDESNALQLKVPQFKDLSAVWKNKATSITVKLDELVATCLTLEAEAEQVGTQLYKLKGSPFASLARIRSHLDDLAVAGQQQFEALKRRSKEERQVQKSHAEMAKVVYSCLKHRDKLLYDAPFTQHLHDLVACQAATDKSMGHLNKLVEQFELLKKEINELQLQRQSEVWNLLKDEMAKQSVECAPAVPVRDSSIRSKGAIPKQSQARAVSKDKNVVSPVAECKPRFNLGMPDNVAPPFQSLQVHGQQEPMDNIHHSLPAGGDTEDIIKANQTLRYVTQDLFNKGFAVYKDYLSSLDTTMPDTDQDEQQLM